MKININAGLFVVAAALASVGCVSESEEFSDGRLQSPPSAAESDVEILDRGIASESEVDVSRGEKLAATSLSGTASAATTTGGRFGRWYRDNYSAVRAEAREFWPNSFGCAAYASTALQMYGKASGNWRFGVDQVLLTNGVESQIKSLGWRSISSMNALQPGDVVLTDKSVSNVEGTWSHVYVFQGYLRSGIAQVSDNNGNLLERNLGPGPRATSILAYRAP